MTRQERIRRIKTRITQLDRSINKLTRGVRCWWLKPIANRVEKLYDRRDRWEEHLVAAELHTPEFYSRA